MKDYQNKGTRYNSYRHFFKDVGQFIHVTGDIKTFLYNFELLSFDKKLEFLYKDYGLAAFFDKTSGELLEPINILVEGREIKYGITISSDEEADHLGWFSVDKIKHQIFNNSVEVLEHRLQECEDAEERKLLINDDLQRIKNRLIKNTSDLRHQGYWGERDKLPFIKFQIPVQLDQCENYGLGAADYKYEKYLNKKLREIDKSENNNLSTSKQEDNLQLSVLKTLQTNLSQKQQKALREALLNKKFISDIPESDFLYWFSGGPIKDIKRIKWLVSKRMLVYLLDGSVSNKAGICLSFNFPQGNNCFEITTGKNKDSKIDSHDRPKSGYSEIDEIIESLRPFAATP